MFDHSAQFFTLNHPAVQEFVTDAIAGTVFSVTEGEGVYIPGIDTLMPGGSSTEYTVRMVIKMDRTTSWNRILNVNHGADHGLYINGGTIPYPDGRGGSPDFPVDEWAALTVTTAANGNTYAPAAFY